MTSRDQTHVIVGASLAGAKAAETLRTEGYDGRIVLIGAEPHLPYERPPLSKGYLKDAADRDSVFVHDVGWYADNDIDVRRDTEATDLDPDTHTVTIDGDTSIVYDRLLLATGAAPRRLDVPGADLGGVHYLRTIDDASHLAVIGAGWIGTEVAAAARHHNLDVTLVGNTQTPLEHALGPEVGAIYRDLHTANGVELHLDTTVTELVGETHVQGVRAADGTVIDADLVVVGIGAVPRIELARRAGLTVGAGIDVSSTLRTTHEAVYAAGDVASAWHPWLRRRLRVEHWANALNQGITAGRNMLGAAESYERVPYFYSDQYDLGMEYSGHNQDYDQVLFRGDPADGKFIAFWMKDSTVIAAMNANVWDAVEPLQALIRTQRPVNPDHLTDPDHPLDTVRPTS